MFSRWRIGDEILRGRRPREAESRASAPSRSPSRSRRRRSTAGRSSCASRARSPTAKSKLTTRVDRDDQRRRQPGQQQVRRLVAVPVARRAAPAHRQHAVDESGRQRAATDRAASPDRESGRRTRTAATRSRTSTPRRRPRSAGCGTAARCPSCSGTGTASRRATAGPVWNSGNMPAHATANSVIASAKRLIDVRHVLLQQQQDRRDQRAGVADADPPHEVDVMANAQPTGMLLPQMPMPLANR